MSSTGYHHCYSLLLMLEDDPLEDRADRDECDLIAFDPLDDRTDPDEDDLIAYDPLDDRTDPDEDDLIAYDPLDDRTDHDECDLMAFDALDDRTDPAEDHLIVFDPLDSRADPEEDDLIVFDLGLVQDDDPESEDADLAPPGEREHVVARLERMRDPGASVIELENIPPRLWKETLAPFHRQQRMAIARRIPDAQLRELAIELAFELDMADCSAADKRARARNAARRTGYPLPSPAPGHAAIRPSVQVNLRLRRDDHERLTHAATAVGLKPTTLARSLVLNGAAMILREHGKEHLAPPKPTYTPLRLD